MEWRSSRSRLGGMKEKSNELMTDVAAKGGDGVGVAEEASPAASPVQGSI
jgi:hypothetical protein